MNEDRKTDVKGPLPPLAPPDPFLQALVGMVNDLDLSFPITLTVSGLLISGELVSGRRYFEALAEEMKRALGGQVKDVEETATEVRLIGDIYRRKSAAEEASQEEPPFTQVYLIHLRNARLLRPGDPENPETGVWWRGRLEAVDGFVFGGLVR